MTTKKQHILLLDIGTASLTTAIIAMERAGRSDVLQVYRRYQMPSLRRNPSYFQRQVFMHITDTFHQIMRERPSLCFQRVFVGLAAPFYTARTLKLMKRFNKERAVFRGDIDALIAEGKKQFIGNLPHIPQLAVFEEIAIGTALNGYPTTQAIGRKAETLSLTVRFAAMHQAFASEFENDLSAFGCQFSVSYFTFPPLYKTLLSYIMTSRGVEAIVDIGGEMTEVTMVRDGVIEDVFTIPIGVMEIAEGIMHEFAVDYMNGVTILKRFLANKLTETDTGRVDELLRDIIITWKSHFSRVFERAPKSPHKEFAIFLLGGGAVVDDVKALFKTLPALQSIQNSVKIYVVDPSAFREQAEGLERIAGPEDFGILTLLLVGNKIRHSAV